MTGHSVVEIKPHKLEVEGSTPSTRTIHPQRKGKNMKICFTLSMPSNNSWNGKWSGDEKLFAIIHNVGRSKKAKDQAKEIISKGNYSYNFGDGWCARICAKFVNSEQAKKIKRKSQGFCGYDWMVDSILTHNKIIANK